MRPMPDIRLACISRCFRGTPCATRIAPASLHPSSKQISIHPTFRHLPLGFRTRDAHDGYGSTTVKHAVPTIATSSWLHQTQRPLWVQLRCSRKPNAHFVYIVWAVHYAAPAVGTTSWLQTTLRPIRLQLSGSQTHAAPPSGISA